jgi:hypothetical protein
MASLRRIAVVLTIIAAAPISSAGAETSARCPKPEQQAEVVKLLIAATDRTRMVAEENPLLLADLGYYETELASNERCGSAVAAVSRPSH